MSTRIEPVHRGAYSAGTTYSVNELVDWQGNVYWHKSYESTTGVDPSNTEIWAWVSDAGDAQPYIDRAENSARVAEAAEIAAVSAKTDAEAAKTAAQTARTGAENAQTRAEAAAARAEAAADTTNLDPTLSMIGGHAEASTVGYRLGNLDGQINASWEIGQYRYSNVTEIVKGNSDRGIRTKTGVRLRKGDVVVTVSDKTARVYIGRNIENAVEFQYKTDIPMTAWADDVYYLYLLWSDSSHKVVTDEDIAELLSTLRIYRPDGLVQRIFNDLYEDAPTIISSAVSRGAAGDISLGDLKLDLSTRSRDSYVKINVTSNNSSVTKYTTYLYYDEEHTRLIKEVDNLTFGTEYDISEHINSETNYLFVVATGFTSRFAVTARATLGHFAPKVAAGGDGDSGPVTIDGDELMSILSEVYDVSGNAEPMALSDDDLVDGGEDNE